ncbi:MAG: flavin reductase family protein [Ruminococcus sp.]|nr:flavin reductase family protein [Ruminococcus sp.]
MSYHSYNEKEHWKGSVLEAPLPPVLVSCGDEQSPNVLTVAWTGILNTQPPVTYISLRPERFSYPIIKERGEFVINLPTEELVRAVDYCGVKSGRNTDKLAQTGLTVTKGVAVSAPMINECPLSLECRVRQIIKLGTHDMFMADIVGVNAAKELLDNNGRLCLERAKLLAYSHGEYYGLGRKLGSFGYSVRKKKQKTNSAKKRKK